MPDGDEGTFELIPLEDGRWGMTALRSDALDVVEVGRTGSRIQITSCRPRMPTWGSAASASGSSLENRT